jgi:hypothetical protein
MFSVPSDLVNQPVGAKELERNRLALYRNSN